MDSRNPFKREKNKYIISKSFADIAVLYLTAWAYSFAEEQDEEFEKTYKNDSLICVEDNISILS